ncbi:MAG: hypothetical protein ABIH46_05700 [Chloroflexota bacterium]
MIGDALRGDNVWRGAAETDHKVHYYYTSPTGGAPIRWCNWMVAASKVWGTYEEVDCEHCLDKMARLILRRIEGKER